MDINIETLINAAPEIVYDAITTQKGIEGWWAKDCTIATKTGEISVIIFHPQGKAFDMHFRIDELIKNKKVLWSCPHNSNPAWLTTKISFHISEDGEGSKLHFKHADFPANYDSKMEAGTWNQFMQSLKNYCETGTGQPWA